MTPLNLPPKLWTPPALILRGQAETLDRALARVGVPRHIRRAIEREIARSLGARSKDILARVRRDHAEASMPVLLALLAARQRAIDVEIALTDSAESAANSTFYTYSAQITGAAAADRDVVVGVAWVDNKANSLTSATIDGIAAAIDVQQETDGVSVNAGAALIRARVPTGTTAQIIIFFDVEAIASSIDTYRVTGADPTLAGSDGAQGLTSPQSISLDVPAGGGAIATARANDAGGAGTFTWTGLTEDTDRTVENANNAHSSAHDEFGTIKAPLAVQAAASGGGSNGLSLVGVSFSPRF